MAKQREMSDSPRIDTDDRLMLQQSAQNSDSQQELDRFSMQIKATINQMSNPEPNAELHYQTMLRELTNNPESAVSAVFEMYQATPEGDYIERWSQVQLLTDLRSNAALSVFDRILATPIPPEKAPDMITYSTVGEEVMIRTTAIEGITRLAVAGERQARELLRRHIQHESFSVRRAAIQGYLEAGGQGAREELQRILPKQDQFILEIRRSNVEDVPQPRIDQAARNSKDTDQVPPARIQNRLRTQE